MLRFIDLTGQILLDDTQSQFAFFNTVSDCFVEIDGEQTWQSWEDFETSLLTGMDFSGVDGSPEQRRAVLARFKSLFPSPWRDDKPQGPSVPPTLDDLSHSLLLRTHRMHQAILEFDGDPGACSEHVMEWVDAVAAMDKALGFGDESGEVVPT